MPATVSEPLHLTPLLVDKPWGGQRLRDLGRQVPDGATIGESWEVADLDTDTTAVAQPVTLVETGPHAGQSLQQLIALDRRGLLGDAPDLDGRFPLLVKLLDAHQHLSVQVHPPAAYVQDHPEVTAKTETWVVLDAEHDAELFVGVAPGVTLPMLATAVGTPGLVPLLGRVPAIPGEVHHLPAGTIHALTAGVLVAEVQTPSDTTFRLYDWTDKYGRIERDLHIGQGLRAVELSWEHNVAPARPQAAPGTAPATTSAVVDTPDYRMTRQHLPASATTEITDDTMRVVLVLGGQLQGDGFDRALGAGDTVVLPAAWQGSLWTTGEATTWLETTVPSTAQP